MSAPAPSLFTPAAKAMAEKLGLSRRIRRGPHGSRESESEYRGRHE
jgi:hypothetical protein